MMTRYLSEAGSTQMADGFCLTEIPTVRGPLNFESTRRSDKRGAACNVYPSVDFIKYSYSQSRPASPLRKLC
jgi:hypothetical protein